MVFCLRCTSMHIYSYPFECPINVYIYVVSMLSIITWFRFVACICISFFLSISLSLSHFFFEPFTFRIHFIFILCHDFSWQWKSISTIHFLLTYPPLTLVWSHSIHPSIYLFSPQLFVFRIRFATVRRLLLIALLINALANK